MPGNHHVTGAGRGFLLCVRTASCLVSFLQMKYNEKYGQVCVSGKTTTRKKGEGDAPMKTMSYRLTTDNKERGARK